MATELANLRSNLADRLDDFRQSNSPLSSLKTLIQAAVELCAHTASTNATKRADELFDDDPSKTRFQYRVEQFGVHYSELNATMAYTTMLEVAQSDPVPSRRVASLYFFQESYKAQNSTSSFLTPTPSADPIVTSGTLPLQQFLSIRREREWVTSASYCISSNLSSSASNSSLATSAVLSANSLFKPAMRCISSAIVASEDAAATALYNPLMRLIRTILDKLLNQTTHETNDNLRSACIKFTENVILCFSNKNPQQQKVKKGKKSGNDDDFSLEDLPDGHSNISKKHLSSIGDDCFTCLRGWVEIGGQVSIVKMEEDAYSELEFIKTAKNSFLLAEQEDSPPEFAWQLRMKSYAMAINAFAIAGSTRITHFSAAAQTLARLTKNPPSGSPTGLNSKAGVQSTVAAIKASTLKLLRNPLSVASGSDEELKNALVYVNMESQAVKAQKVADKENKLKSANRRTRQEANTFYEWEAADTSKRQQEEKDAINKIRDKKIARGLGNGIQQPTSISDMADLILKNIKHLPSNPPASTAAGGSSNSDPKNLQFVVEMIQSQGASLEKNVSNWYENAGGVSWDMSIDENGETSFEISEKTPTQSSDAFAHQCEVAAADAFSRLVSSGRGNSTVRGESIANFDFTEEGRRKALLNTPTPANSGSVGAQGGSLGGSWGEHMQGVRDSIASRLAWTLNVQPRGELALASALLDKSLESLPNEGADNIQRHSKLNALREKYPLVPAVLNRDFVNGNASSRGPKTSEPNLASRTLYEAYVSDLDKDSADNNTYDSAVDALTLSMAHIHTVASLKQTDKQLSLPQEYLRRNAAKDAVSTTARTLSIVPKSTQQTIENMTLVGDIREVGQSTGRASTIAERAQLKAAGKAAEKRANMVMLALRDAIFLRTNERSRKEALMGLVGLATGRLPTVTTVADRALKLVMNKIYTKSPELEAMVTVIAKEDLAEARRYCEEKYEDTQASIEQAKSEMPEDELKWLNELAPIGELEKEIFARVKRSISLYLVLCLHNIEIVGALLSAGSGERMSTFAKAFRHELPKFCKAAGKKWGEAVIAKSVAEQVGDAETPLLLALLDNLAPASATQLAPESLVEACLEIQKSRFKDDKPDLRFIVPIVSSLEREKLIVMLPDFAKAGPLVLGAALSRMRERLTRQYNQYRAEEQEPNMRGLTTCEQLVGLHELSINIFDSVKEYLNAIEVLYKNTEACTDRVLMASFEHMSTKYANGTPLPKAFMRTVILSINEHHSLLAFICNTLLKRLAKNNIWETRDQWRGFMKAASILVTQDTPNSVAVVTGLEFDQFKEICGGECKPKLQIIRAVLERTNKWEELDDRKKAIVL
ncbi:hypothetical protein TrLO_g13807 [Triparma laevis f. longispina]|uniref:Symplekin n=1 Tax=Triparma laevis f. longispina TaxID=1714387 RepID=A0A9W7KT51_9STRA|nr:hypothetical protein TrLO_g13807 [Triparma laevis f. longispina]